MITIQTKIFDTRAAIVDIKGVVDEWADKQNVERSIASLPLGITTIVLDLRKMKYGWTDFLTDWLLIPFMRRCANIRIVARGDTIKRLTCLVDATHMNQISSIEFYDNIEDAVRQFSH